MKTCRLLWAICIIASLGIRKIIAQPNKASVSKVWVADLKNGMYKNPVLYSDYSDPDAIRVGEDFYMVASSFEYMPGLPILHSKDLVNWELMGHALKRQVPVDIYNRPQHGNGAGRRPSATITRS